MSWYAYNQPSPNKAFKPRQKLQVSCCCDCRLPCFCLSEEASSLFKKTRWNAYVWCSLLGCGHYMVPLIWVCGVSDHDDSVCNIDIELSTGVIYVTQVNLDVDTQWNGVSWFRCYGFPPSKTQCDTVLNPESSTHRLATVAMPTEGASEKLQISLCCVERRGAAT